MDLEKTEENAPARKRVNLDHLNPEEQLMRRKLKSRRPDFSGQEESSDRFDREAACRGSSLPAGEPQCQHQAPDDQRQAAEDQDQAPDGERQPSAAEQRSTSHTDAQKKFFQSPDLVSQLLPFLDLSSTLVLTSVLPLARQLLQRKFIWRGLIRRSLQNLDNSYEEWEKVNSTGFYWNEEDLTKVEQLVKILQKLESPEPLLQDLLDFICETFETDDDDESGAVKLSCSRHILHKVNKQGFQLLELAEGKMGTCLQSVTEFSLQVDFDEGYEEAVEGSVEAVIARVQRQKPQQIQKVKLRAHVLSSRHCPNAVLLQKSKTFEAYYISVTDFDAEDWSWFAQLVQQKKIRDGALSIEWIACDSEDIVKAKIEDLKKVWEAVDNCLSIFHEEEEGEDFYRDCGEDGVHVDDSCPFRDEADADMTECGWRRLQEIWREEQESEQQTVISWQDAPDDLFYKAGAKTKKMRKQLTVAAIRKAARKPFRRIL